MVPIITTALGVLTSIYSFSLSVFRFTTLEMELVSVRDYLREILPLGITSAVLVEQFRSLQSSASLTKNQFLVIYAAQTLYCCYCYAKFVRGIDFDRTSTQDNKVFIVTGSNQGIGFEVARELVRLNGTVVLACRSLDRANEARTKILNDTGKDPTKVIVMKLDLCDLNSVREFVKVRLKIF